MPYDPVREHVGNEQLRELMRKAYDPKNYRYEKIIGRRTRTGALKLKKLKPIHRHIISMHLGSFSNRDIAFHLDLDEVTVSRVINDPLSQQLIQDHAAGIDAELHSLLPLGVDAVRRALIEGDHKTALNAADKLFHATGKYKHDGNEASETAEDVIARALGVAQTQADTIKELARPNRPKALDVEFSEAKDGNQSDKLLEALPRSAQLDVDGSS